MKKVRSYIVLIGIILISFNKGYSQFNTVYWMDHLPQSMNENPGKMSDCKFFIDLPTVPNFSFNFNNSGFSLFNAIKTVPNSVDTTYLLNLNGIENALGNKNAINFETNFSLLNFGFSVSNNMFFSFGINYKIFENFQYPSDLISLQNGNYRADGSPIALHFREDLMIHREVFVGMTMEVMQGLTVGARLKYLNGYVNINTKKLNIDWSTETHQDSMYEWTFDTDIEMRAAAPIPWEITRNDAGIIHSLTYSQDIINNPMDHLHTLLFPRNTGFGIDIGAEYVFMNKFTFSASVIDLGFIKWKTNPALITQNASFKFSGIDISQLLAGNLDPTQADTEQVGLTDELIDTLLTVFNPNIISQIYTTGLNTKIYAGANYLVTDWFNLGLLYRGMFVNERLYSSYTASANLNFLKGWAFTASYSMMDGFSSNIGVGMSYKVGPFQMYIITDNIAPMVWAANESNFSDEWLLKTKRVNLSFGMNFTICGNKSGDIGLIE